MTTYDVRPAASRAVSREAWRETWHAFSFGEHYDPDNVGFGSLLAVNEDRLAPGSGYDQHAHRDTEIVTWVLEGELVHADGSGRREVVRPGIVQHLRAGRGVVHSEHNEGSSPVHFVQMWLQPGVLDDEPGYELREVPGLPGLVPALELPGAVLHVARLSPADSVRLPAAPYVHLHVTRGSARPAGVGDLVPGDAADVGDVVAGDAVRVTDGVGEELVAGASGAELLVWEMTPG